jgi:ABC-type nitrate/sulfonate/bicarbonate transport system substrate-binding protein
MAMVAAADALIERSPEIAAAAVRAIVHTQRALRTNVELAFEVGRRLFPASEGALIVDLIRRDLPYYDPAISPRSIAAMTQFSRDLRILEGHPAFEQIVAVQFAHLWQGQPG